SYVYYRTPELYFKLGLLRNGLPLLASEILARIPVNIVDRPVSVFGAYGIAFLLRRLVPAFSMPRPLR
ncbi:MAG: hypothetical protein LBI86_10235, partial [Treponema sp.]|nr:hypothetical protein [Treponema sp.]